MLASTERLLEECDPLPRDSTAGIQTPSAFGRYRVVHQVGVGVLGPVFRGYDPDHDRVVAIKAFFLDLTPEQAADLAAEFDRLSERAIPHGFIITPLSGGAEGSTAYLAEEYFVAESADVALKQYGPPPLADAMRLIGQLAGAIDAAAAAGVHHGALHPRDVLVAPHEMRLTGLGVVPALERVGFRPQARIPYAAPERMLGKPVTHLSDVFSLACVSFELLTGRRPVPSGGAVTVETALIPAADAAALSEVFARVLSERPEDRYVSALAFAAALKHALTGAPLQGGAEVETPAPRRVSRPRRVALLPFEEETPAPGPAHAPVAGLEDAPLAGPIEAGESPDAAADSRPSESPAEQKRAPRRQRPPRAPAAPPAVMPSLLGSPEPSARRELEFAPGAETAPEPGIVSVPEPAPAVDDVAEPAAASEPARATEAELDLEPVPERRRGVEVVPEPGPVIESVPETVAAVPPAGVASGVPASAPTFEPEPVVVLSPPAEPEMDREAETVLSIFRSEAADPVEASPPRRNLVAPLGMLAVGLVIGFAAGYLVAPRGTRVTAAAPAAPVAAAVPAAPAPSTLAAHSPAQPTQAPIPPAASPAAGTQAPGAAAAKPAAPVKAARGTLVINSTPAGARVFVDGREAGATPLTLREVKAGLHKVRLERTGYRPWMSTVRVAAGGQRKLTVPLRRRAGG